MKIRDAVEANPLAAAIGLYTLIAVVAAVVSYLAIFTTFSGYDDEGTLLVTLKAFANGQALYRDVYSAYGPFYYELFGGLFSLSGQAVTTDAGRTIVIVVWVTTSLLIGLAVHRLSGRLFLGAAGMITAFAALDVLVNEPMHPQGLCVLLLTGFVLLAACAPSWRPGWAGTASGALIGALLLTKVNLGIFAIAAIFLAAVWTLGPLYRLRWLRLAVTLAFLAMPLMIMSRDVTVYWVRELLVLEFFAAVAILLAAAQLRPRQGDDEERLVRWLLAAAAGLAVAFVLILGIILLTGPNPADVYNGIITQALRVRDALVLQFEFPPSTLDWSIAAVAAAALIAHLRSGAPARASIWPGLLRALAGVSILFSVAHIHPFGLDPTSNNSVILPMVLAWVAALPPAGVHESAQKRFLRLLLPALAVAESLQVYPVAGSQVGISSVLFIPVAGLCLGDALRELQGWAAARRGPALQQLGAIVTVLSVALAGMLALDTMVLPGASYAVAYRDQPKLPLPGAGLLRLPAATTETYVGVVNLLHKYRCTTFVGYPSIDSLYLWSGIESPAPTLPNAWMDAFDRAEQQRVVDELRASPRPCVLRNEGQAAGYLKEGPPADLPLVHYIFHGFHPVSEVGDFEFMLPKGRSGG